MLFDITIKQKLKGLKPLLLLAL